VCVFISVCCLCVSVCLCVYVYVCAGLTLRRLLVSLLCGVSGSYALLGLTYLEPYRIPHPALNIIAFFAMQLPAWCAIGRLWNQALLDQGVVAAVVGCE
jgi:hypothetical protein